MHCFRKLKTDGSCKNEMGKQKENGAACCGMSKAVGYAQSVSIMHRPNTCYTADFFTAFTRIFK